MRRWHAGARVARVEAAREAGQPARVVLESGEEVAAARGVVVAVDGPEARRLLGDALEVRWGRGAGW